jgi:signal transduction histidine kinase
MDTQLKAILTFIQSSECINEDEKKSISSALMGVDEELEILIFKLDRLEKIKRTTSILLDETIAELEQKRKAIEVVNVTLQKSLEDLKAAQAQLIHSEKMASLGELTAGIAHEIQNPLNFVNNFSDVNKELLSEMKDELRKGNLTEVESIANDVIENEEKVNHHGKRADAIVKGMLQHSRTSSGQKELTDVNALADEYLRLAYHGLRAKDKSFNAKFETDFDPSLPQINVVRQDMGRVILNLINNAFYAVNKKLNTQSSQLEADFSPTVSIQTKKLNDKVEIGISDNGNGIPKAIIDKIFQPFFTTKPTGQGTGLGLSLAYDIVKAHGGDIRVETKEGEGSEFIIQLPVV